MPNLDDEDAWEGRSDAAVESLVAQMRGLGSKPERSPRLKSTLLEPSALPSVPEVGLNQTVQITVELPAYMVAGLMVRGVFSNERLRQFVREGLIGSGVTWWYPRFMSAQKAKIIEGYFNQ